MNYGISAAESGVLSSIRSPVVPEIKIITDKCASGWSTRFGVGSGYMYHDLCVNDRDAAVLLHRVIFSAFHECVEKIEKIYGIKGE